MQLIAKVTGAGTPGGAVTLRDGTQVFATAPLIAGSATFDGSLLGVGAHALTAHYGGDVANAEVDSSVLSQVVLTPDFSAALDPATLSVRTGRSTTATVIVTGLGSFADTMRVEASNLPAYATLTVATQSVPLSSSNSARITISVATGSGQASLRPAEWPFWQAGAPVMALLLIVPFCGSARLQSRRFLMVLVAKCGARRDLWMWLFSARRLVRWFLLFRPDHARGKLHGHSPCARRNISAVPHDLSAAACHELTR